MSIVHKLPESLIRCIAAGEVVERPASVLKELLENSIDAGASQIKVEWEESGSKKILITDNGSSMTPTDARLALERHATSKIIIMEDLENINTYGFRGEALPAIAAVSRLTLITRPSNASEGWRIQCEGGDIKQEGPFGAPVGTTIVVEDLFYNTPARKKFLRSDGTERGLLLRTVEDIGLAAQHTQFQVFSEKKEAMSLRASRNSASFEDNLLSRLQSVWGMERTASLKPVRESGRYVSVLGWVSEAQAHQSSMRFQKIYVNNRPITSRRLIRAIYEAYKGRLMVNRHPLAVIFVDINPTMVDVNVHPSKREVRFSHEEEVFGFVLRALQKALYNEVQNPEGGETPQVDQVREVPSSPYGSEKTFEWSKMSSPIQQTVSEAALKVQAPAVEVQTVFSQEAPVTQISVEMFQKAKFEVLTQLYGTFIIAKLEDGLYIFDQHAAAERALYEKLSANTQNKTPHQQAMLIPWVWEASLQTAEVIKEQLDHFSKLGYALEHFGAQSFRVKSVPAALGDSPKVRAMLEGLAEDLLTGAIPKQWDAILIRAACRGSVKANDILKPPEMQKIIEDLQACACPLTCPHGRPTFLHISPDELAKRFKRI